MQFLHHGLPKQRLRGSSPRIFILDFRLGRVAEDAVIYPLQASQVVDTYSPLLGQT